MVVSGKHLLHFRQLLASVGEEAPVRSSAGFERIFLKNHGLGSHYEKCRHDYNDDVRNEDWRVNGLMLKVSG